MKRKNLLEKQFKSSIIFEVNSKKVGGSEVRKKLNTIQFIRGIAILFVMAFHANYMFSERYDFSFFNIGNWHSRSGGVDLFFAVSGLMIYYINQNNFGLKPKAILFLKKRIMKIIPLYWMLTFVGFGICVVLPQLGDPKDGTISNTLLSMFFLHPDPTVGVAWSLRHILFFYILFAILISFPNKITKGIIFTWLAVSLLCLAGIPPFEKLSSFLFSINNIEIWSGALVGYLSSRMRIKNEKLVIFIGVMCYMFIWVTNSLEVLNIPNKLIFFCIGSIFILSGVMSIDLRRDVKMPRLLTYIGDASYSIFLSHVQCILFFMLVFDKLNIMKLIGKDITLVLIMILSPAMGIVLHEVMEKPIDSFLRKKFIVNNKQPRKLTA